MNPNATMRASHALQQVMHCSEPQLFNEHFAWTHFQGPKIDPESEPTVRSRTVRDRTVWTTFSVNFQARFRGQNLGAG